LITGSLVALSPYNDAFKETCILAIVAARPVSALQQNPPEIDLFFPYHNQPIDPMQQWVMVECRNSFFEGSRHTLTALQHMMRETFPLSEHLVGVKKDVDPPSYVQNDPFVDLSSLVSMEEASSYQNVNVLGEEEWPSHDATPLDDSQSKALKDILTRRVALVQGPPGTGKTFVSVKAVQILVDNLRKHDAPIIVTAQTNHAVDQILRHTRSFVPNYVRLGGRSKDLEIMKRTLFMLRSALPPRKFPQSLKTQAANAMRKATATCKDLLAPLELGKNPLHHKYLEHMGLLTKDQAESLEMDNDSILDKPQDAPGELMQQWLGKALVDCRRPVCPDDFGYEWEEEDLEIEQLQELEAEAFTPDDDDIEALKGEVFLLSDNYRGKGAGITDSEIQEILDTTSDLTTIQFNQRGPIYNYLMRQLKKRLLVQVRKVAEGYHKAYHLRRVGLWDEDVSLLSKQRIIGMTTTGLSKYRALIAALRPRVVLVEEAAETMEAPVTVACLPTVEHLILVGDHQQLRPHTQVKKFEDAPFHLNLSLFERLVLNEIEYDQLNRQRRMIPEIRRLLRPIYEEDLKDHNSVKDVSNRPPVKGMGGLNTYFFTHEWPEARDANSSCYNDPEAKFIVGFLDYLVLNGEDPMGVTILTFYNGQRKQLIKHTRSHPNLRMYPIKVVTVDSYQGEENDIVLLSLVRQNRNHSIGFLSNDNRACVALSRAKRGFYLFGDAKLLACESWTWAEVVEIMYQTRVPKSRRKSGEERRIGYCLPLECVRHGRKSWVEYTDDWDHIYGGCDRPCGGILTCDHPCPYPCHPFEHDLINCAMVCARKLDCGHNCEGMSTVRLGMKYTNSTTATCCDTCRCRICDQRANGQRPLLKSGPSRQRPSPPRNLLIDSSFQTPANPPPTFSSPEKWDAYVDGGAKADDARMLAKRKEEDAAYEAARRDGMVQSGRTGKLIETSPQKPRASVSKNTELLIDLDLNNGNNEVEPAQEAKARYASAARSSDVQKEQFDMNLLD
jgi:helicase required for RNAi-mediated heterochromatin assembly 1